MAKKTEPEPGEQLDLIETQPENTKQIARIARQYKKAVAARQLEGKEEVKLKEKLRNAIKEAKIAPEADGSFKFTVQGIKISVEPRDELIKVKLEDNDDGDGDE